MMVVSQPRAYDSEFYGGNAYNEYLSLQMVKECLSFPYEETTESDTVEASRQLTRSDIASIPSIKHDQIRRLNQGICILSMIRIYPGCSVFNSWSRQLW